MLDSRFSPEAAAALRAAIRDAGGVEVFAIGKTDAEGRVVDLEVHARGQAGAVPALLTRPVAGDVVIHNHPSGLLAASDADMALAGRYGEDGVGVVIVNNAVNASFWVVEPHRKKRMDVSEDEVVAFFRERLPAAIPGYEARPGQVEMARAVCRTLNAGGIATLEAGTGTGKSLAYLVPAALWARANQAKVVVATYTITLQGQLVNSDLPALAAGGIQISYALLKGRTNYACRRRLAEAQRELGRASADEAATLAALAAWAQTSADGSRSDLPFPVDEDLWERVASDHDQTLRARCPFFGSCFYYQTRRAAAAAHLLVANHHLLLSDLVVKGDTGGEVGLLPRYDRLIIDEGHHLEDAATSLFEARVSARAIARAIGPLLDRDKRPGALSRIGAMQLALGAPLAPADMQKGTDALDLLRRTLPETRVHCRGVLEDAADALLSPSAPAARVTKEVEQTVLWEGRVAPRLAEMGRALADAANRLAALDEVLHTLPEELLTRDPQPVFDVARAQKRLAEVAAICEAFRLDSEDTVRWMELARERGTVPNAALCRAPVEVGPSLKQRVFEAMHAVAITSATLTVGGRFEHLISRLGIAGLNTEDDPVTTAIFPSPFDYRRQALLGLPRDLPEPDAAGFDEAAASFIVSALRITGGGAFVLCTSFTQLRSLHARVDAALDGALPLLRQGDLGRNILLDRFRDSPSSVLFGTDSFWEGVSVSGDALRLVIIPRLPFRVPTEPVSQARHERIAALGQDPFRAYSLPLAVLRLRQGFGRLIRTKRDRGAVVILDPRVNSRWYGRVFLTSLPEMERATGPSRAVLERLSAFYAARPVSG